jgi:pimeloyl-ACP methyl ester carboxylesterase
MTCGGEVHRLRRPDGTELQVECYGPPDAPALVLTHGWGCDSTEWYYLKRQLAAHFRLIVWDLPGVGRSSRPPTQDYSLEKMAHDLRAVIDMAGDRAVTLLGHSIGGMIILTCCRLFPEVVRERVRGLALAHTTYTNPLRTMALGRVFTALQKPLIEPLLHLTIWLSPVVWLMNCLSYLNGSAHWSTARQSFAGTETRGQLDFVTRFVLKTSPAVLARGTLGMLRYDASAVLHTIGIPVLVITGDRDPVTRPEASEELRAELPRARLVQLVPAKHMGLIEHNQQFATVLQEFCHEGPADRIAQRPVPA